MTIRDLTVAAAIAATLGVAGGALAQTAPPPAAAPGAQQVNPSPMPPGSRADQAPGMGGAATQGRDGTAQQVNPSPMPPGSRADQAPGMSPTQRAQGGRPDAGVPGGTGAMAPSGQPDVGRGTADTTQRTPGSMPGTSSTVPGATAQDTTPGTTPRGATTGATTPGTATEGGGRLVPGANSFTEGQARDRIGGAGFNDVQGLRLDEQGIWRGRAMRNGQQTGVALDYQGNVAATE